MKEGTNVIADEREGTLIFVDSPWNMPDGTPADLLCRVKFDDGKSSSTNGWYRMSELKLSNKETPKVTRKMKEQIEFSQFLEIEKQLEIKIGQIHEVEKIAKSDKMLKMAVDFGHGDIRTVMTNIGNKVNPEDLKGRKFPFITNLKPAKIMGIESTAMIMVPSIEGEIDISESPVIGSSLI
jgi:methionine--tRNA ligase beta chain